MKKRNLRCSVLFLLMLFIPLKMLFSEGMTVKIDNYEITVPTGWLAQRTDSGTVFILYSPLEENDDCQENINLVYEKLPVKYSVKGYMEASRDMINKIYGDVELIEEGKNYHIITLNANGNLLKQIQFVDIKGTDVYVITGTSTPASFDRYFETFKSIYKSFKY